MYVTRTGHTYMFVTRTWNRVGFNDFNIYHVSNTISIVTYAHNAFSISDDLIFKFNIKDTNQGVRSLMSGEA